MNSQFAQLISLLQAIMPYEAPGDQQCTNRAVALLGGVFPEKNASIFRSILKEHNVLVGSPKEESTIQFFGDAWKSYENKRQCKRPLCEEQAVSDAVMHVTYGNANSRRSRNLIVVLLSHEEFPRFCKPTAAKPILSTLNKKKAMVVHCHAAHDGSSKKSSLKRTGVWFLS